MSSDTLVRCPCGDYHPFGFVCEKAQHSSKHLADRHEHSRHDHADTCCDHAHEHTHDHAHGDCCGHEHAAPQSIDWGTLGEASATRAIYRIVNMDCPMEEALIRKKLATVRGITGLEFNLMQRVLTVNHELPSTDAIEAALKAVDMTPEPLAVAKGVEATFLVNGMDCPEEERLIRSKLGAMPGVFALNFNLMQRVLKVRHEPSALPAISAALASLNMDARLFD
ncbi:cation transporter, partial [uncultured Desulfovibrio sp.]|uniref:cation transporter n=2 Tax=uncultured Desulfovibrio sp. TaxID=167968 RepID=UPI0026704656